MTEIKTTIDFDPDFLRERYKSERDKQLVLFRIFQKIIVGGKSLKESHLATKLM